MKFSASTEEKDQRCIVTSAGIITAARGDLVVVLVVKRWEDIPTALADALALTQIKAGEQ